MVKKVVFHDDCPKCKRKMVKTDKGNSKALFYYCNNCKQKYRVYTAYKTITVDCPHCNKKIKLTKNTINQLYMSTIFNYEVKKAKVQI